MKSTNFLIAIVITALLVAVTAAAAEPRQRLISVTGEGRVEAAPDMATIRLGVTKEAKEAGVAMAAVNDAVSAILARLTGMGIDPRDIQTQRLTLNPLWSGSSSSGAPRNTITGFSASNIVMVRVRDLDGLGPVLDAVIAGGANEFNGLRFGVEEPEPLVKQARRAAVADAMARAGVLAEAAGLELGPVQSITEHGGRPEPVMMDMAAARGTGAAVAPGELTVSASVAMVFAIAD